ncbi:MAG: hypothetical protein P4N60_19780 [Verrucomicrobiae bacterium]|nr:hypothetical protein [Verrucomicrobiae bacterium]
MNYDKLSDNLDKKMLDFNLKILGFLASILIRPLAFCTEVMFRRNFGERYFSLVTVTYSFFLWCIPAGFINVGAGEGMQWTFLYRYGWPHVAQWLTHHTSPKAVMFAISTVFFYSATKNYSQIWMRQQKGIIWYSMSRGESIFGTESVMVKGFYSGLICVALFIVSPALGLFFFLSRVAGFYLWRKEQESIYNRYLDEQDARIMAGNIEPAMLGNKPTRETSGLYCPLPKRFTGEHRAHVAKVSGSVMARTTARSSDEVASPGTAPAAATAAPPADLPKSSLAADASRIYHDSREAVTPLVPVLKFLRRLVLPALIVVLIVLGFRFVKTHWPQPAVAPAVQSEPAQPPAAIPTARPTAAVAPPVSVPPPVAATPAADRVQSQPAQTAPIIHNASDLFSDNATAPRTQIAGLAAAVNSLNTFSNYCQTALSADADNIDKIPNALIRDRMTKLATTISTELGTIITHQQEYLDSLIPGAAADASVERSAAPMISARQSGINALHRLEAQIKRALP